MAREAELFDGTVLEFPDDTPDEVIARVAKAQTASRKTAMETADEAQLQADVPQGDPLTGEKERYQFWPERLVRGVIEQGKNVLGVTGEVMRGETDPMSDKAIGAMADAAMLASPGAPARMTTSRMAGAVPEAAPPPAAVAAETRPVMQAQQVVNETGSQMAAPIFIAESRVPAAAIATRLKEAPGGGAIQRAADEYRAQFQEKAREIATRTAGRELGESAVEGAAMRQAIDEAMEAGGKAVDESYGVMRRAIDPEKEVNVSEAVAPVLAQIRAERAAAKQTGMPSTLAPLERLLEEPVSFNGLQRMRTNLRESVGWNKTEPGFGEADLKGAYGALSAAMDSAVRQTAKGNADDAVRLWKAADARNAQKVATNKALRQAVKTESDERLAGSILKLAHSKTGNTRELSLLTRQVGTRKADEMAGFAIKTLSEASPESFATIYGGLSEQGKSILFRDKDVRKSLDALLTIAQSMQKNQRLFEDTPKTGGTVMQGMVGGALLADPTTAILGILGANATARMLSRPATAKAAVKYASAVQALSKKPQDTRLLDAMRRAAQEFGDMVDAEKGVPQLAAQPKQENQR